MTSRTTRPDRRSARRPRPRGAACRAVGRRSASRRHPSCARPCSWNVSGDFALLNRLQGEGDALAAADAQRDDPALEPVAAHRMDEPRREHGTGGTDRMAVRDRSTLDVHDVLRETELAGDDDGDRGEGFVDLDALDLRDGPARALPRLLDRGNGATAEHARLDGGDAIGHQAGDRPEAALFGPFLVRHDDRRGTGVDPRRIAGGDRAALAEGRLQRPPFLHPGGPAVMLVPGGRRPGPAAPHPDPGDLPPEFAGGPAPP